MAVTKLNLTGGDTPFDPADPSTFPEGFSTFEDSVATEIAATAEPLYGGGTIVELTTGVWSYDAPARAAGNHPIVFVGWSDPADITNGITTPANINDTDRWVQVSAP